MRSDLRCFYILYGARYIQAAVTVLLEPKRKDFLEMMESWQKRRKLDFCREIPRLLKLRKLCKYTAEQLKMNMWQFVADRLFEFFAVLCSGSLQNITMTRLTITILIVTATSVTSDMIFIQSMMKTLIIIVINSIAWQIAAVTKRMNHASAHIESAAYFKHSFAATLCVILLYLLMVLQVYWFGLILKVAIRLLRGHGVEDIRSDDEDEEPGPPDASMSGPILLRLAQDECFLAYSVPYSYTDLLSDLARWPVEPEALALTAAGKEVLALRLGNQSAQHRVCIVARAHPGETHASWVMRGVMEFLMGDPEAQSCLAQLAWLLVPMLNPDGVMAGRTRTNLDAVDLNRHHHDDSAPETKGLKSALQAEAQEGELLAFIDIHSHSRRRGIFAIANASDGDRLVSLMASRTHLLDAAGTSRSEIRAQDAGVGRVAAASQGYKYSLTIESSLCARHVEVGGEHLLLQDLASVGRAICLAVADLLSSTDETANQAPPETAAKVPNSMFAEGVVDAEDHDEADEEAILEEERRPDSS
ncbi:Cytosolic carboxypeptidase 2 [Symbiodinium microadriaticum]|uniref:Cytosolic carboxypeptidase 2 n=1 Tax=Symbiodinium microadriaticum TaxID=2951 RepID=A0A1Q9CQC3_SYMMI|nr:Cytosolic carboxypeptidase 2 [Symbiodinium microadriaticum]